LAELLGVTLGKYSFDQLARREPPQQWSRPDTAQFPVDGLVMGRRVAVAASNLPLGDEFEPGPIQVVGFQSVL
jgi:hypothetical protein